MWLRVVSCLWKRASWWAHMQNQLGGVHSMRDAYFTISELQRERKTFKTCHDEVIRHDELCVPSSLQEDTRKTSRTTNSKVTAALADFG